MVKFTAKIKEPSQFTFDTTSVIKLRGFLYNISPSTRVEIIIKVDDNLNFIRNIMFTDDVSDLQYMNIIKYYNAKHVAFEFYNDDVKNDTPDYYKSRVDEMIRQIVIALIFSNNSSMYEEINNHKTVFEINHDDVFDWYFTLNRSGNNNNYDCEIQSCVVNPLINPDWFVSLTIFKYITGRPLVIASPDCTMPRIDLLNKPLMC